MAQPTPPKQLPKEGPEAYAAFCAYCLMGPLDRSLRSVAQKLGKADSLIERWSARHHWVDRAWKFDGTEDHAEAEEQKQKLEKVKKQQATAATAAVIVNIKGLTALAGRLEESQAELERMDILKLYRLGRRAVKAGVLTARLIRETCYQAKEWKLDLEDEASKENGPTQAPEPMVQECKCGKGHEIDFTRLPCESSAAYEAFEVYCQGTHRPVSAVADECSTSPRQIRRWRERYQWKIRAVWLLAYARQPGPEMPAVGEEEKDKSPVILVMQCWCGEPHKIDYHQFPCETPRSFAAFGVYRNLGDQRSIRATAAACGSVPSQIWTWAQRYQWRARAKQFDAECQPRVSGTEREKVRKRLLDALSHAEAAQAITLRIFNVCRRRREELNNIDIRDLLRLALDAAWDLGAVQQAEWEAHAWSLGAELKRVGTTTYLILPETASRDRVRGRGQASLDLD